jgi:hypothetical protein
LLVFWTNHSNDENGPGMRVLAKVGTFNADRSDLDWGGDETLVEVAPAPVPVRRRLRQHDPEIVNEHYFYAKPLLINGRLYVRGSLGAIHGYTDDGKYQCSAGAGCKPIPAEHWRDARDEKAGFIHEIYWGLGYSFVQRWKAQGRTIVPDSPIYKTRELLASPYEVTPGRFKKIAPLNEMYAQARPLSAAPQELRDDILKGKPTNLRREPKYVNFEASLLAADGTRGLADAAEFRRPDGKWVVLRDNRAPGAVGNRYYAALKDKPEDNYPPAILTSLAGYACPEAGELPNGWVWILGNIPPRRQFFYVTVSTNGVVFDRSRHLLSIEGEPRPDRIGGGGGPQYPHSVATGPNIWIIYSIGKTRMGVTKLPIKELTGLYDPGVLD